MVFGVVLGRIYTHLYTIYALDLTNYTLGIFMGEHLDFLMVLYIYKYSYTF